MSGPFGSRVHTDPVLGELRRSRGLWRGEMTLEGGRLPLCLAGGRAGPDPEAVALARVLTTELERCRDAIAAALQDHAGACAESPEEGSSRPAAGSPAFDSPEAAWRLATPEYALLAPLDGRLVIEIGYTVPWDEEHTLGARVRDGTLAELSGSVLAP